MNLKDKVRDLLAQRKYQSLAEARDAFRELHIEVVQARYKAQKWSSEERILLNLGSILEDAYKGIKSYLDAKAKLETFAAYEKQTA